MARPVLDPARSLPAPPQPAWDDLRIFLAVAAHGSLSGAAGALGQSQATVGRRVRALEGTLGVALFRRGPNRLDLTEAGRAVLEAAAPMTGAAEAVPRVAAACRPDPQAPVRITATASVTMFLSAHAVELSRAAAPVEVAFLPTRRRLDLGAGEADIALRMRRLPAAGTPEAGGLVARRIGRIAFAMYERAGDAAQAVIAPSEDPTLSRQAAFVAQIANGRPVAARIGDMPIRYQAARGGLGAAFLPCWLGDGDPALARLCAPPEELAEDVYLLMHERARARPAVARTARALAALFRRHAGALAGTDEPR